jgi:hypothetical protein
MGARPAETEGADTSGLAIASLVLGIVWLFGLSSIAAIVLGVRAMREIDAAQGALGGRALAVAGVAIGLAGLASTGLVVAFVIASAHH